MNQCKQIQIIRDTVIFRKLESKNPKHLFITEWKKQTTFWSLKNNTYGYYKTFLTSDYNNYIYKCSFKYWCSINIQIPTKSNTSYRHVWTLQQQKSWEQEASDP